PEGQQENTYTSASAGTARISTRGNSFTAFCNISNTNINQFFMENQFRESDIPLGDLRKLGLMKNGKPDLSKEDIDALLAGHRTDLITLHDIHGDGIHIQKMDAKLSLQRDANGHMSLQLHPIYRDVKKHPM